MEFGAATEAIDWRPARRLRHVVAVSLFNLFHPGHPNNLGPSSARSRYHYEVDTWSGHTASWVPFYRSEQVPYDSNLDWDRLALDPQSPAALSGVQHRADAGPVRLRIRACHSYVPAAGEQSTAAAAQATHHGAAWRSTLNSGAQGYTWRGSDEAAAGGVGGSGGRSLHQVQKPAPCDYVAQRLPHAHQRRREPGPPSPPPPPQTAAATAGPGAARDSRQSFQDGPGSGALDDRGGSDSLLLVPTPASSGDTDSSSSSSSSKRRIHVEPAEAAAHDCDSDNGGAASPVEGSGPGLGAKASANGKTHLPWCEGDGTAEAGRETEWEHGVSHNGEHGGNQWTQRSNGAPEVCSYGVGQQAQELQQPDEVDLVVEELVEWVCRHQQWGAGECEGPARRQAQVEEPAGVLEEQGIGEAAQSQGQQQHREQVEEQLGSAGEQQGSTTGAAAPCVNGQHVPHGNAVAGFSDLGAGAGVQASVQGMPSGQELQLGVVQQGGSSLVVPCAAISSACTASSAEGGEPELPPQLAGTGPEGRSNQGSGLEAPMHLHPDKPAAGAGGGTAAAAAAAESEVVAEYVFDMRELVPLEPRALQRSPWCANVPLLLLQDRQLYTLPSALPRPPGPKPQPGPSTSASSFSRTLYAPRPRSHTAAAALPAFGGRGPMGQGGRRPAGHAHDSPVGGRMAVAEAAAGPAGPRVRTRHRHRASLDERQMNGAAAGAGGGGRGGGARALGGGREGRLADDKRALLRWMLGSGSLVTPLEAATSLDSELDEELGGLEGLGELGELDGLEGLENAAAAAVTAAAAQLQAHQAGIASGGTAEQPAALDADAGDDGSRRPDAEALFQALLRERPGGVDGSGDSGGDLAAALLDPGPPPGFLPGALAVLFGQDLPDRTSNNGAAPPHSRRTAHSRGQSQDALSFLAHNALASTPMGADGAAPASPRTLFGLLSRRAASTPAIRGASASGGTGQRVVLGPGTAGVLGEQEAGQEEEDDTITQEQLLALAGMGGSSEEGERLGDGLTGGSSKGGSEWGSSVGGLTAASSASDLAGRGVGGEAPGGLGARPGGARVWGSSSGAGGGPVSVSAAPVRAPPQASATWVGSGQMPRGASTGSLADARSLTEPVAAAAAGGGAGAGAGATGSALLRGVLRRPPRPVGGAESMPVSRSSSPAPIAGLQPLHKDSSRQQQQQQQHGEQQRQRPGIAWSAGSGRGGKGQGQQQQRMCDVGEVYASMRRLGEQQDRLRRARSASLAAQQRLAAALEARRRREETAVAAERISTECALWRHRAAVAGAQLGLLHGAAVRQRALLLARAGALEHAAGVLQVAETRRLGAEAQLQGPGGFPQLRQLHAALVARRNRMVAELGRIYQIGPVSEALLEPAPLDVTLDCSWAGEAGCTGEDEEAGAGEPRVGEENSRRLNGTLPDQRHQQPYTVAGASGRPGQHTLVPAAPYAAGGGAGGGGGGRLVAVPPPRAMRLAVVGLEVMPDLVQRSLENASGWSPLDLGRAYDGDQRTAASLGYLAAVVDLAAAYLGVPLRYPVAPRMSVSYISDPVPPSIAVRSGSAPSTPMHPPQAGGQGTGVSGGAATSGGLGSYAPGGEWRLLNVAVGMLSGGAAAAPAAAAGSQLPASTAVGTLPGPRTAAAGGGGCGGGGGRLAVFSTLLNTQLDPRVAHTPLGPPPEDAHPAGLCPASGLPLFWGEGARDRTRFAYAVYLLNKNVEQLLAAHGMPPVATNQPLVNLYALVNAAVSGLANSAAAAAAAKARQRSVQRREAGEGR